MSSSYESDQVISAPLHTNIPQPIEAKVIVLNNHTTSAQNLQSKPPDAALSLICTSTPNKTKGVRFNMEDHNDISISVGIEGSLLFDVSSVQVDAADDKSEKIKDAETTSSDEVLEIGPTSDKDKTVYDRVASGESYKYLCSTCGKSFSTNFGVRRHFQRDHLNLRPHKCSHCTSTFYLESAKNQHEDSKHNGRKEFKCSFRGCKSSFARKYNLESHMESHKERDERKMFSCSDCDKQFRVETSLYRHKQRFHMASRKAYKCDICGLVFSFKSNKTRDMKSCNKLSNKKKYRL